MTDEPGDERARVVISDSVLTDSRTAQFVFWGTRLENYYEKAQEAWENLELTGLEKEAANIGDFNW